MLAFEIVFETTLTTYSSCGGMLAAPYFTLASGEVKAVTLLAIVVATAARIWAEFLTAGD
jgi:hypothetical protein